MEEMYLNEGMPAGEADKVKEEPADALFAPEPGPTAPEAAAPAETPEEEEDLTAAELAAWDEFQAAYPEMTAENIPDDVFRLIGEGETPVNAMRRVELKELKAENSALKQKLAAAETLQKNRLSTPGSMLGRASAPGDAFLEGLEIQPA